VTSRPFCVLATMAVLSVSSASSTLACVCTEITTFGDSMKRAPIVLAGRIASQGFRDPEHVYQAFDVAVSIELSVLRVIKGKEPRRRVRVWNPFAGSSCDDDGFKELAPGTLVAFAVAKASALDRETWSAFGMTPTKGDYMVGTCGVHWKTLATEEEITSFAVRSVPPNKQMQRRSRRKRWSFAADLCVGRT
jgi:hypothetical protein